MHLLYGAYRSSQTLQEGIGKKKCESLRVNKWYLGGKGKKCAKKQCKKQWNKGLKHKYALVSKRKRKKNGKKGKKRWSCKRCDDNKVVTKIGKKKKCKEPPSIKPTKKQCEVKCDTLTVWEGGTAMPRGRSHHEMVFLPGVDGAMGTVMVVGGVWGDLSRVLLYDVVTKQWTPGAPGAIPDHNRNEAGMVLIPSMPEADAETLLVWGGYAKGEYLSSGEFYSSKGVLLSSIVWNKDALGPPTPHHPLARRKHGMVFLPANDRAEFGKVMVAGGEPSYATVVYDVAKKRWTGKEPMATARYGHGMVFLPGVGTLGTVMVAGGGTFDDNGEEGGGSVASVEFYDVETNKWTGKEPMATARIDHGMVILPGVGAMGTVMVAGGTFDDNGDAGGGSVASVELYDVKTNKWTAGVQMATARYGHGMVFLPGVDGAMGTVMVAGGYNSDFVASVELYDVAAGITCADSCK